MASCKADFLGTLEVKKVGLVNLSAEEIIIYFEKFYSSKYNLQHCLSLVMLFFCTGLKINIKFDETELLLFMNDYSTYLNADFVARSKNTRTVGWTFNKGRTDRLVSDIRAIYTRKNKTRLT